MEKRNDAGTDEPHRPQRDKNAAPGTARRSRKRSAQAPPRGSANEANDAGANDGVSYAPRHRREVEDWGVHRREILRRRRCRIWPYVVLSLNSEEQYHHIIIKCQSSVGNCEGSASPFSLPRGTTISRNIITLLGPVSVSVIRPIRFVI